MAAGSARRQPPAAGRCRGSRAADRNAGLVHVRTSGVVLLVSPGRRHRPQRRDRGAGVIGGRSSTFVLTVRQGRRADIEACARIVVADPLWRRYRLTLAAARRVLREGISRQERERRTRAELVVAARGGAVAGFILYHPRGPFHHSGHRPSIYGGPPAHRTRLRHPLTRP